MKLASYFTLSATAMAMMVYYAYYTRKQFYPTVLFLVSSKLSFIVACNLALSVALLVAKFIKSIYFGNLREAEVEVIMEKAKYAIVETSLALTIFRNELSTFNISLFGTMILIKLLHRLSKCRLEYLEQIAPVSRYIQMRMTFLLISLMLIDSVGIAYAVYNIMQKGKSVLILFGFEFGLLLIYAFNLKVRFIIQMIDNMLTNGLQSRGVCIMIVDLLCDLVKVVTYLAFFSLVFLYYGVPFHLIRDLWGTCFSFQRKFVSFIKYLQLTRNLDGRFPDATPEEVEHAGNCLVCREDMERGKKLPCGHVFHLDCLRMWLQHQQTCPLCRADIPSGGPVEPAPAVAPPAELPVNNEAPEAPGARAAPAAQENLGAAEFAGDVPPSPAGTPERLRRTGGLRRGLLGGETPITRDVMPNMYVCLEDLSVYKNPTENSEKTRTIKKGAVVFVTLRATTGSTSWLMVADGWVIEETMSSSGKKPNLCPLCKTVESLEAPSPETPGGNEEFKLPTTPSSPSHSTKEIRVYSRSHFLSRLEPHPPVAHTRPNVAVHDALEADDKSIGRLERIMRLQNELQEFTEQLSDITRRMVQFQRQLGALTQEELSVRKSTVTTEAGVSATKADVDVAVKTEPDNAEISSL